MVGMVGRWNFLWFFSVYVMDDKSSPMGFTYLFRWSLVSSTHEKLRLKKSMAILGGGNSNIFMFIPIWGNDPIWRVFFKGVETRNHQLAIDFPHILLRNCVWKCGKFNEPCLQECQMVPKMEPSSSPQEAFRWHQWQWQACQLVHWYRHRCAWSEFYKVFKCGQSERLDCFSS